MDAPVQDARGATVGDLHEARLLQAMAHVADRVAIWTHYYHPSLVAGDPFAARLFRHEPVTASLAGVTLTLHRRDYRESLEQAGFCGGPKPVSKWLTRDSITNALKQFGFPNIHIAFEQVDHQNGPSFAICASK